MQVEIITPKNSGEPKRIRITSADGTVVMVTESEWAYAISHPKIGR